MCGRPSSALHHASSVASVANTPYKFAMGPGALTNRTLHPVLEWTQHLTVAPLNSKGSCSSKAADLGFLAALFLGLAFGVVSRAFSSAVERCESWTSSLAGERSCFRGLSTGERGSSGSNSNVLEETQPAGLLKRQRSPLVSTTSTVEFGGRSLILDELFSKPNLTKAPFAPTLALRAGIVYLILTS